MTKLRQPYYMEWSYWLVGAPDDDDGVVSDTRPLVITALDRVLAVSGK